MTNQRWRCTTAGVALLLLALGTAPAAADPPEVLRFQGTIDSLAGNPVQDGSYDMQAAVYDVPSGGQPIWTSPLVPTQVTGQAYSLVLTPAVAGELADAFSEGPRYLEVTVLDGPGVTVSETLLPREEIGSVPFALNAASAPGVPVGGIILWDQITGCDDVADACPCGFEEVTQLRARFPVGVDLDSTSGTVSDSLGGAVNGSLQGGQETHSHGSKEAGEDMGSSDSTTVARPSNKNHVPPFHAVLFCRRLPSE